MARLYSKKKGKSGSKKPSKDKKLTWVRYNNDEIESLVIKLAKAGNNSGKIGLILRDTYGIPDVQKLTGMKISKVLEKNKLLPKFPDDFMALVKKEIRILKHLENNKHDMTTKRGLILTESKIKRLTKYYKSIGRLPNDFKYERDKIKLLIE